MALNYFNKEGFKIISLGLIREIPNELINSKPYLELNASNGD